MFLVILRAQGQTVLAFWPTSVQHRNKNEINQLMYKVRPPGPASLTSSYDPTGLTMGFDPTGIIMECRVPPLDSK